MFSQILFLRARRTLATILAFSLLASSTPAYAINMWYCGIATQAFGTATSWGVNDACGINPAAAPAADDTVILDKSAAGRVVVMSGATSIKGLILAKSFTGTLKQLAILKISSGSGGFKMGSGRFVGGIFPITLSGSLTMTGGIMNGLQNTFTMTGSLALSKGGTTAAGLGVVSGSSSYGQFTSTGTIVMAGSLADQTFLVNSNVWTRLKHLTINNRAGTTIDDVIVGASGSLALSGALTVTLGRLDLVTKSTVLQVQRGVTAADSAQAEIWTSQNMTMSGTILINDAAILTVSGGTLTLNDDSDQAVDLDGQRIFNLTINNAGATTNNDVVYAGGALDMSGALAVTLGSLDLSTNSLAAVVKGGGITVTNTAEATFDGGGNLTMSGSLSVGDVASFSMGSTSTLRFNGVFANIDTNNAVLYRLTVNSASGARLVSPQRVFNRLQVGTGGTLSLVAFTLSATGAGIRNYGIIRESTGKMVHSGSILITNASFNETSPIRPPERVYFQVFDEDENLLGTSQESMTITGSVPGDSETVTLTETANNSGVFQGSVATGNGVGSTGILQATADTTLTASYTDGDDGFTHTDTAAFTVFSESTTSGGGTSGGGSGGGGGGGGRSYLKTSTPTTTPVVTPRTPAMINGLTRSEIAEQAKALRLENRKKAMEMRKERANARKAKRGR